MSDSEQGSRVGSQIGPYKLRRLLGKGGMGEVYEAEDTVKDRIVALKLLPESASTDPVFRSVARIANTVDSYLLAEGGGRVHAATRTPLILPKDTAIFGDDPGMADDRVVDVETAAFNLRDIPQILGALMSAFTREDVSAILALTSNAYQDEQGMNRARFGASLRSFFDYFHVRSMTISPGQESVNVSFQGSKVIVDALVLRLL